MSLDVPTLEPVKNKQRMNFSIDLRLVVGLLLVVIVVLVWLWSPWSAPAANGRTISVSGSAESTAAPDEFVFSPSYEFKNADKAAALKDLTTKSDVVTSELKKLGVSESQIKSDSSGYNAGSYYYNYDASDRQYTYTLALTVTLSDQKLVQKVQDYLVSTSPTGSVSPNANFSTAKQKQLEAQARDDATKEARAKADQSAKNLGFKIDKVKSVEDGGYAGGIMPYASQGAALDAKAASDNSLQVQTGENKLNYSVNVVYYIH